MRKSKMHPFLVMALAAAVLLVVSACSVNVKKGENGEDKKVDIDTPIGHLHVSTTPDASDIGLPVFPGARLKEKGDGNNSRANVNISAGSFGLKVVALEYESDTMPDKVVSFYKDELKKYGKVVECHTREHGGHVVTDHSKKSSKDLSCDGEEDGPTIELKVGTDDNQRIVAVDPQDKGCTFSLVRVQTRGSETI